MKTKTALLIVALIAMLDCGAGAQAGGRSITLSIFVLDAKSNPATDVAVGDLTVRDDNRPATVTNITRDDRPLRLGIVIDKSNSERTSDLYRAAMRGLNPFLKQVMRLNDDQVFFETFDTAADPSEWLRPAQLGNASIDVQPGGGSSLFDAVDLACKERMTGQSAEGRRVLLIVTDGGDNASRVNLQTAIASAQQTGTVIIAISTREQNNIYQRQDTAGVLKRFAEATGGVDFDDLSPKQIPKVYAHIAQLLHSMFQVTFVPNVSGGNREPHRIQIKPSSRKKLRILAAKQYLAPS